MAAGPRRVASAFRGFIYRVGEPARWWVWWWSERGRAALLLLVGIHGKAKVGDGAEAPPLLMRGEPGQ